jgi:hypothetical protein
LHKAAGKRYYEQPYLLQKSVLKAF